MAENRDPLSLRIVAALIQHMLRKGGLSHEDVAAMCADMDEDAAHELVCIMLDGESGGNLEVEFRRQQIRLKTARIARGEDGA